MCSVTEKVILLYVFSNWKKCVSHSKYREPGLFWMDPDTTIHFDGSRSCLSIRKSFKLHALSNYFMWQILYTNYLLNIIKFVSSIISSEAGLFRETEQFTFFFNRIFYLLIILPRSGSATMLFTHFKNRSLSLPVSITRLWFTFTPGS